MAFQRAVTEGVTVNQVKDDRALLAWGDYEAIGKEVERLDIQASKRANAQGK